jgi:AcrR family transcriptional regulator
MSLTRAATKRPALAGNDAGYEPETARRARTRQALLDAATRLFAERGYHETGVPDIVKAAGVSQGTFYQYFSHRRDVLMALTQVAHTNAADRPPMSGADFGDLIRAEINWYMIESIRHTMLSKIWHDAAAYDREIAELMRQARAARVAQFAVLIRAMKSAASLDADVAAKAIVAMIEEFTYRQFVDGDGPACNTATALAASETLSAMVLRALGLSTPQGDPATLA